ncbi:MAG: PEP-CTERM sorting domain-containing protein [Methylococcales bacterium]|nr:PEP-CTERM sorting domain-containing protein [Methylococcales bacterium]
MKTNILLAAVALAATSGAANASSITVYGGLQTTAPGASNSPTALPFTLDALGILGFHNTSAYTAGDVLTSIDITYTTIYAPTAVVTNLSGIIGSAAPYTYTVGTSATETFFAPTATLGTENFATTSTTGVIASNGGSETLTPTESTSGTAGTITTSLSSYDSNWNITIDGGNLGYSVTGGSSSNVSINGTITTEVAVTYNYTSGSTVPEPASIALIAAGLAGFGFRRKAKA